jgi:hypothetical protein
MPLLRRSSRRARPRCRARPRGPDRQAVVTVGTCAQRSPWSRLGALAVRASLVSGLCIGGWLGMTAVAAAGERPEIDPPRVEVEHQVVDQEPRAELDRPATDRPATEQPEVERPLVERPHVEKPAVEPPGTDSKRPVDRVDQPATVDDTGSTPTPAPQVRQHSVAPPSADRAASLPKDTMVADAAARILPEPQAPDASEPSHVVPPTTPNPDPPAPPASWLSTGATAAVAGLRDLLVILPTGPSPSDPASTGVVDPETRPTTGILFFEPSASPD